MENLEMHVYEVSVKIPDPYNEVHLHRRILNIGTRLNRKHPNSSVTHPRYNKSTGVSTFLIVSLEEISQEEVEKYVDKNFLRVKKHPYTGKRRSRERINYDILCVIAECTEGANITKIVYGANLNFFMRKIYLDSLEEKGFVRKDEETNRYKITSRGKRWRSEYGRTIELSPSTSKQAL